MPICSLKESYQMQCVCVCVFVCVCACVKLRVIGGNNKPLHLQCVRDRIHTKKNEKIDR
jgi:hypothetical protein